MSSVSRVYQLFLAVEQEYPFWLHQHHTTLLVLTGGIFSSCQGMFCEAEVSKYEFNDVLLSSKYEFSDVLRS